MIDNKSVEIILKIINDQFTALESIKIPRDANFDEILLIKTNIETIRDDTLNYFSKILEDEDKLDKELVDKIYNKYEIFEKQLNYLYIELNFVFLQIGVKLKKEVETESKKILPQIISFASLFVGVVGLIISNIIILNSFTIKNILVTDITFIFAITLIFYFFCLLWSNFINEKYRKIVLFVVFPITLLVLILALVLIGIFM